MKKLIITLIAFLTILTGCKTFENKPILKEIGRLGLSLLFNEALNKNPDWDPYMRGFSNVISRPSSAISGGLSKELTHYIDGIDIAEDSRAALYQFANTITRFVEDVIKANEGKLKDDKLYEILLSISEVIDDTLTPMPAAKKTLTVITPAGKVVIE